MLVFDTPRQWFALAFAVNTEAWLNPQYAAFATDVPLLAVLVWLALLGDRWWPMWASAFQFLGMLMAIIIVADPRVRPVAYMAALVMWSYLTVIALVIGTWREARRSRALARSDPA